MNKRTIFTIIFACFLISCTGKTNAPKPDNNMTICPQDAKQCPDGSWVGRSGEKCEFVCQK
jgi:hypothetical protein